MVRRAVTRVMEQHATAELDELEDFEAVVQWFRPRIFRFALASLRDRDLAETITQDCFLRAYLARARFRNECSLQTWLMQIAVNLVRDHSRNRRLQFWKRTRQTAFDAHGLERWVVDRGRDPEALTSSREQVRGVWKAAGELPEKQRTVFLLRFVEDLELLEIAAATGMKEGTVKVHLFRALQAIRKKLGATV